MSKEEIMGIYLPIAAKSPGFEHGDFVTCFAHAVIRADYQNFCLLEPAAEALIQKYDLARKHAEETKRTQATEGTPPTTYPEHKPNSEEMH